MADLSLDRHVFQEIVAKSCKASCAARAGGVGAAGPLDEPARAGGLIPVERMTLRYKHHRDPQDTLRARLRELACSRVRYGYPRLTMLLKRKGWQVNAKRIYRLYSEEGLIMRTQKRRQQAQR
jgi:hypothetical protein